MEIYEFKEICEDFEACMIERRAGEVLWFDRDDERIKHLRVKDVYSDGGVVVELKFDKAFWKLWFVPKEDKKKRK